MTKTARAPRVAEIAADEGYNLAGAPVLLAKLTAYVSRPVFAQLAQLATACNGEYSRHLSAFMFPAGAEAARESFAAQARAILSNPPPAATARPKPARISCDELIRRLTRPDEYTDAPTVETPPAARVSTSRPIAHTITDRTPAGYGPTQPALF